MIVRIRQKKKLGAWLALAAAGCLLVGTAALAPDWAGKFSGGTAAVAQADTRQNDSASGRDVVQPSPSTPSAATVSADNSPPFSLQAREGIVVEESLQGPKVLYQKNANESIPVASLTKLMTALLVLEKYNLNQPVIISQSAVEVEGAQGDLQPGQQLTVKQLLQIMLIESSNRAAKQLSELVGTDYFVGLMNGKAKAMGLSATHYADPSGLSSDSHSSAHDIAVLAEYLWSHYPLFDQITGTKTMNVYLADGTLHHTLHTTDDLLGKDPYIIGGKTGFTDEAMGCLMVVRKNPAKGDYIVSVVLGSPDRFGEMENMIQFAEK